MGSEEEGGVWFSLVAQGLHCLTSTGLCSRVVWQALSLCDSCCILYKVTVW